MSDDLDAYLRGEALQVFVFDDNEAEPTAYLGMAKLPLITLANDKPIRGTFELMKATGKRNGTIDVSLQWKYTYLPASVSVKTIPKPQPRKSLTEKNELIIPSTVDESPALMSPLESSTPKHKEPTPQFPTSSAQASSTTEVRTPTAKVRSKPPPPRKALTKDTGKTKETGAEVEKLAAEMSVDELIQAAEKPDVTKAEKEMSVDELIQAADETPTPTPAEDSEGISSDADMTDEAMVAEEMAKTAEKAEDAEGDTMFEDGDFSGSSDSEIGEEVDLPVSIDVAESPERDGNISEASNQTSDSEGLVVAVNAGKKASIENVFPTVTIVVSSLMFYPNASLLEDDDVRQIFVAYKFLDCDPAELETPSALPKPPPNKLMHYNFKRVFHVDSERNEIKRNYLLHMLMPDHPTKGRLIFSVVSEPVDLDGDCTDVGYADVDFMQLATEGKDLHETDIEVYDVDEGEEPIGCLTVTVEVIEALRSLYGS